MARWSDLMRLNAYQEFRDYLSRTPTAGCYQIGTFRNGEFSPKYIGRSTDLYRRMSDYNNIAKCHNDEILNRLFSERSHLWFRVMKPVNWKALEANMLYRMGIGDEGVYVWNRRYEYAALTIVDID